MKPEQFSESYARKIINSPEAQAVIEIMKNQSTEVMNEVMKSIQCGNYERAKVLLQPAMENKNMQEMLQKVGNKFG